MPIPIVYRKLGPAGLAVDFYDMTTKTGYKTFYGMRLDDAGTMKYALITDTLACYSELNEEGYTLGNNAALSLDFDLDVTTPLRIQGKAFVAVPFSGHNSSAADDFDVTVTAALYKVASGGGTTQIGSTATEVMTVDVTGIGTDSYHVFAARINVPANTILNGEKIRLTVTVTAAGVNKKIFLYHNPSNTGTTSEILTTALKLQIPFRMNT